MKHGEAVLWGMFIEARISMLHGLLSEDEFMQLESFLSRVPLKLALGGIKSDKLYDLMRADKKDKDGRIRFALPTAVGKMAVIDDVSFDTIDAALCYAQAHGWSLKVFTS